MEPSHVQPVMVCLTKETRRLFHKYFLYLLTITGHRRPSKFLCCTRLIREMRAYEDILLRKQFVVEYNVKLIRAFKASLLHC